MPTILLLTSLSVTALAFHSNLTSQSDWGIIGDPCVERTPPTTALTCRQCAGSVSDSNAKMVNGFNINPFDQDKCIDIADGNFPSSQCEELKDFNGQAGASAVVVCKAVVAECSADPSQCNVVSAFIHPSCHTDARGASDAYRWCNFWTSSSEPALDGNCQGSAGCQGTFMTIMRGAPRSAPEYITGDQNFIRKYLMKEPQKNLCITTTIAGQPNEITELNIVLDSIYLTTAVVLCTQYYKDGKSCEGFWWNTGNGCGPGSEICKLNIRFAYKFETCSPDSGEPGCDCHEPTLHSSMSSPLDNTVTPAVVQDVFKTRVGYEVTVSPEALQTGDAKSGFEQCEQKTDCNTFSFGGDEKWPTGSKAMVYSSGEEEAITTSNGIALTRIKPRLGSYFV